MKRAGTTAARLAVAGGVQSVIEKRRFAIGPTNLRGQFEPLAANEYVVHESAVARSTRTSTSCIGGRSSTPT